MNLNRYASGANWGRIAQLLLILLAALLVSLWVAVPRAYAYDTSQAYWNGNKTVLWDVCEGKSASGNRDAKIKSVTLNSIAVVGADSGATVSNFCQPGPWKVGEALSQYYGNLGTSNSSEVSKQLVITPMPGYYVTKVTVACSASNENGPTVIASPYSCGTWGSGIASEKSFSGSYSGSMTTELPSSAVGHLSNLSPLTTGGSYGESVFFILIEVAPLPAPLYVEYQYGDVYSSLTSAGKSIFNNADAWLDDDTSRNVYGNGTGAGVTVADTRFTYAYQKGLSDSAAAAEAAKWRHYANIITDEAAASAAEAGYVFTGWKVEYYASCTKNYVFSDKIGENPSLLATQQVPLLGHVKLTAQWKKIETTTATVSKTVSGNMGDQNLSISFTASVENGTLKGKQWTKTDASGAKTSGTISSDTYNFNLKHGENVVIRGIPIGVSLTVVETNPGIYDTHIKVNNGTESIISNATTTNVVPGTGLIVSYRNNYDATIDTGVKLNDAPVVPIVLVVSIGGLLLLMGKRRNDDA